MRRCFSAVESYFTCFETNTRSSATTVDRFVLLPNVLGFALVFLSVFVCSKTQAAPRTVTHNGEATNITSEAKTDFHIRIDSDTAQNVTKAELRVFNGAPIDGTVTAVAPDFQEFTVDWDANIPINAEVEWEVRFQQNEENAFEVTESFFTPRADPSLDLPLASWDINPGGTVFLINGGANPIVFSNLTFQFPSDLSSDYLRLLLQNPSTGQPGLLTSGTIPAGGNILVAMFPGLKPGDFLAARLDVSSPVNSAVVPQVLGHEHQIPEPGTLLTMCVFIAGAAVIRFGRFC